MCANQLSFFSFFHSCNDGYWAPSRTFDCFCSASDPDKCDWSAAKKIKEMRCEASQCEDLQAAETVDQHQMSWSCSGRAKYDLCWSPCHVGYTVKYTEAKCKCRKGKCAWQFGELCSKSIPLDYLRMALEFTHDIIPQLYQRQSIFESSGDY